MPPHNLPLTMLGTGILWFGWFGFNAGSALAANGVAAQALVNTLLAAAAAMLGWLVVETSRPGTPRRSARLGCGRRPRRHHAVRRLRGRHVARLIGLIAGIVCYLALSIKCALRLDDSLDVIAVHLVGGLVGSLLLGFFADSAINAAVADEGIFFGGWASCSGPGRRRDRRDRVLRHRHLRASPWRSSRRSGCGSTVDDEVTGLDQSQHAESAYQA